MKKIFEFVISGSIILFISMAPMLADPRMGAGSGGWGMSGSYMRMYDPATVQTLNGEITAIDKLVPSKGMSHGVHIMIKTSKETISVHLGPAWYIDNQDVSLEVGQTIEVTGSRITFEGKPAIIAKELKKGDEILTLRDDRGYPAWSGWHRK